MSYQNRSNTSNKQNNTFDASNFAQVTLSETDKDAFMLWAKERAPEFGELLEVVLGDSYRVSFKVDYHNSCTQCAFTQQDNKHNNSGVILISRADNPEEAFLLCCYKIFVMYPDSRLPTQGESNNWG